VPCELSTKVIGALILVGLSVSDGRSTGFQLGNVLA
jgi:hypothetical protein